MGFGSKITLIGISFLISIVIILLFAAHMWVFIAAAGLIIFAASYAGLSFKGPVIEFLKQKSDNRDLILAAGLSVAVCGTVWLVYIFGGQLAAMAGKKGAEAKQVSDWLSNIDYFSAAATIIGACISLIPIVFLIWQNKLIREQMELQRQQNNFDVFARASEMIREGRSDAEITSGLIILNSILRETDEQYIAAIENIAEGVINTHVGHSVICFNIMFESMHIYTEKLLRKECCYCILESCITHINLAIAKVKASLTDRFIIKECLKLYIDYVSIYIYIMPSYEKLFDLCLTGLEICIMWAREAKVKFHGSIISLSDINSLRGKFTKWCDNKTLTEQQLERLKRLEELFLDL